MQASDEEGEIAPVLKYVVNTVPRRIIDSLDCATKKLILLLSVGFCTYPTNFYLIIIRDDRMICCTYTRFRTRLPRVPCRWRLLQAFFSDFPTPMVLFRCVIPIPICRATGSCRVPSCDGRVIACTLLNFFNLLRNGKVQDHADYCCHGKACLHDEHNSIKKPLERVIVAAVGKDIRKVIGYKGCAVADRQARREYKSVAAVERDAFCNNGNSRNGD